jgi:ABC-type Fe3+ transport system permease subunit
VSQLDPNESPPSDNRHLARVDCALPHRRIVRVLALAVIGYAAYVGGIATFAMVDSAIKLSDTKWAWGIIVSAALSSSELFCVNAWSLKNSVIRRIVISCATTLISFIVAHKACRAAGIEQLGQDPLLLPRLAIGVPIFLLVALAIRYTLETEKGAR